jgi:hypothetical protein
MLVTAQVSIPEAVAVTAAGALISWITVTLAVVKQPVEVFVAFNV